MEKLTLLGPIGGEVLTHYQVFEHQVSGLPALENRFGDIWGEEGEFEKAPEVTLGELLSDSDFPHGSHLSSH